MSFDFMNCRQLTPLLHRRFVGFADFGLYAKVVHAGSLPAAKVEGLQENIFVEMLERLAGHKGLKAS